MSETKVTYRPGKKVWTVGFPPRGPSVLDLVKDIIAIVNRVTGNKEGWYVKLPDGSVVVPVVPPVNR